MPREFAIKEVGPDFKNEFVDGLTNEQYHAMHDKISSSSLRKFLQSPMHFHAYLTREDDGDPGEGNEAMAFGTLVHMAILEPALFHDTYITMPDFGAMQSSKNREKRDAWVAEQKAAGKTVCSEGDLKRLEIIINNILKHKIASALIRDSIPELSGFFRCPDTGLPQRIRPDSFKPQMMMMSDFKTSGRDVSRDAFSKAIWSYRYDIQMAMYAEGIRHITGEKVKFPNWICVESNYPHAVAVWVPDEAMLEIGEQDYKSALRGIRECMEKNSWPGYQEEAQMIGFPGWVLAARQV